VVVTANNQLNLSKSIQAGRYDQVNSPNNLLNLPSSTKYISNNLINPIERKNSTNYMQSKGNNLIGQSSSTTNIKYSTNSSSLSINKLESEITRNKNYDQNYNSISGKRVNSRPHTSEKISSNNANSFNSLINSMNTPKKGVTNSLNRSKMSNMPNKNSNNLKNSIKYDNNIKNNTSYGFSSRSVDRAKLRANTPNNINRYQNNQTIQAIKNEPVVDRYNYNNYNGKHIIIYFSRS
jgi:hypothetical protein